MEAYCKFLIGVFIISNTTEYLRNLQKGFEFVAILETFFEFRTGYETLFGLVWYLFFQCSGESKLSMPLQSNNQNLMLDISNQLRELNSNIVKLNKKSRSATICIRRLNCKYKN